MPKRVIVGMSGGVDSAVTAHILKSEGYEVVGLYMSNWKEISEDGCCTGEQDYTDVQAVCSQIGIPYYSADFSRQYWDRVFNHFIDEYRRGRTPNPDVLCNREIKFEEFRRFALEMGADYIATGHYCRIRHEEGKSFLLRAKDENKDQTYFLNQVTSAQLRNVIFPVGGMLKEEVRKYAKEHNLAVAKKKDSTGICFIGERRFREFLSKYIPMKEGDIVTEDGKVVGRHKGVFYYTIGQRKGLGIGGFADGNGESWFVLKKDVEKNLLIVSQGEPETLFSKEIYTEDFNFITEKPSEKEFDCEVRIRHRQPLQKAKAEILDGGGLKIVCEEKQRAVAPGQYAVLYIGDVCLGGGVIEK
ncbi:MAG: tRNA 2-thiouridine(34) synthase MnmA [Clostridiales bacterium]|nr:tRNA 2-thiouridine(34) synthase MnmA [Clostridiales bacterium]